MDRTRFEDIAEEAFNHLPALFKKKIENVEIVVEDVPLSSGQHSLLLGLYHGVPLTKRGTWYGMSPVLPDRISLYQKNIESVCSTDEEIRGKIYEVLCHEIGHYFGMDESQIRNAMKAW
jgi:predicted Zn-dependent protease with MMP-like domain